MSGMMSPARRSKSARNGSRPPRSKAALMQSFYPRLKSKRSTVRSTCVLEGSLGAGFTPNGMATKACGLTDMAASRSCAWGECEQIPPRAILRAQFNVPLISTAWPQRRHWRKRLPRACALPVHDHRPISSIFGTHKQTACVRLQRDACVAGRDLEQFPLSGHTIASKTNFPAAATLGRGELAVRAAKRHLSVTDFHELKFLRAVADHTDTIRSRVQISS